MPDDSEIVRRLFLESLQKISEKQESMSVALAENNANLKNAMKTIDRLEECHQKLESKFDKIAEKQENLHSYMISHEALDNATLQEVTKLNGNLSAQIDRLDEYNEQLEIHIKRTNILEDRLVPIIEKHVEEKVVEGWKESKIKTFAKWAGAITATVAVITAIADFVFKIF